MLDGATPAPLLLLLLRLIANGDFFLLFHVYETCLKLYPWTIVHPTSPYKHVLIKMLFHHYLPDGMLSVALHRIVANMTCSYQI